MVQQHIRGCAVGAAVGDALGMPLEFKRRRAKDDLLREMCAWRLPAGSFTDDTEMALALGESLLAHFPLDAADVVRRFVDWYDAGPADIGNQTQAVLSRIAGGERWEEAVTAVQQRQPDSAGNGSVMRCWPVALAQWRDLGALLADSRLESQVTHPHADCVAGSAFVNAAIHYLLHGETPASAVAQALDAAKVSDGLRQVIEAAPQRKRDQLQNSGWVRHTRESAVWALLTTGSFEEAVVQAVNLGNDADTAGTVTGALAGACYGLEDIPTRWREAVHGRWPLGGDRVWRADDLAAMADDLSALSRQASAGVTHQLGRRAHLVERLPLFSVRRPGGVLA
jgi:ADP-ribosyl-[dinitrogen reductase] hydrolase